MSRYIEFSTTRQDFGEFNLGNPLHDGARPSRLVDSAVIRVDGEPIDFVDESVPDRLHRTLVEMRRQNRDSYHCRQFAALMHDVGLDELETSQFAMPNLDVPIDPNDSSVDAPVVIGLLKDNPLFDLFSNRHMATPAHQPYELTYLHKLGDGGPICLSGLQAAIDMYDGNRAFLSSHYS